MTIHKENSMLNMLRETEGDITALAKVFAKIVSQQNQRGVVFQDMTSEEKLSYANQCVLALSVEVGELASSWPFASWKTDKIDLPNIEREIIDCIFFLVNISCCFDIKPSDLIARFQVVLDNNQRRIDNGIHKKAEY